MSSFDEKSGEKTPQQEMIDAILPLKEIDSTHMGFNLKFRTVVVQESSELGVQISKNESGLPFDFNSLEWGNQTGDYYVHIGRDYLFQGDVAKRIRSLCGISGQHGRFTVDSETGDLSYHDRNSKNGSFVIREGALKKLEPLDKLEIPEREDVLLPLSRTASGDRTCLVLTFEKK